MVMVLTRYVVEHFIINKTFDVRFKFKQCLILHFKILFQKFSKLENYKNYKNIILQIIIKNFKYKLFQFY